MTANFSKFDKRSYKTLTLQQGYSIWSDNYDANTSVWSMDIPLLERMPGIGWSRIRSAIDLACGTGRMGAWLAAKGVQRIDGVDMTKAMLAKAERRKIYRHLWKADVLKWRLPGNRYDLAICSLATCHMAKLDIFYRRLGRLLKKGCFGLIVDYHPHFLLNGIPTHFRTESGENLAIRNHVHLLSDHVQAAGRAGLRMTWMDELIVDRRLFRLGDFWKKYAGHPISILMAWQK